MIVDETGSMNRTKAVTISAYNEWLDEQRTPAEDETDPEDEPNFTLVKFNTTTKMQNYEKISTAPALTNANYNPSSMTALYDAIGETITEFQKEKYNICVIITDGEENSSRKFNNKSATDLIKKMTDENEWEFHYLGANQDAFAVGGSIGITNNRSWEQNEEGTREVYAAMREEVKMGRAKQVRKKKGLF